MINRPSDSQHISIIGANGSGKTQAAQWHLSQRNFHLHPWIIYNFKRDETIDSIPGALDLDLDEMPDSPGIYIAHPLPAESDAVEKQMEEIWERGNIGVYVDEGYMIGRNNQSFRALLTQGRSKRIPVITLSQRPVWMDQFVFTESQFYQVFRLQHKKDRRTVEEFIPADLDKKLPAYHSYYYDVSADKLTILGPVPPLNVIHSTFERRLARRRKAV